MNNDRVLVVVNSGLFIYDQLYDHGTKDQDMHGAHMIFTRNFYNVHLSHVELFDVGQPRLARYPIHWHHAHYVGAKGKYDDPSSVESLRKVSRENLKIGSTGHFGHPVVPKS